MSLEEQLREYDEAILRCSYNYDERGWWMDEDKAAEAKIPFSAIAYALDRGVITRYITWNKQ